MRTMLVDGALVLGGSFAAALLVKATVTLAMTLVACRLARRSRAAVRHVLLAATFAVLLALPVGWFLIPSRVMELTTAPATSTPAAALVVPFMPDTPPRRVERSVSGPVASLTSFRVPIDGLLSVAWALGALALLAPMAAGMWQTQRLRRSGLPWPRGRSVARALASDAGVRRHIDVLRHHAVSGPMTCGIVRPVILLPFDVETWGDEEVQRAVIHELEHVRRWDWASLSVARVVCAAYWFHPLIWIAWNRLRLEAERACDDAVVQRADSTAYASQLVGLAERLSTGGTQPLLAMAARRDLSTRVRSVLDAAQRRGRAGAVCVATVVVAAAVLVTAVAPLRAVPQGQPAPRGTSDPRLAFDAASVRRNTSGVDERFIGWDPRGLTVRNIPLQQLITFAYQIQPFQLQGGPDWMASERFDIVARSERELPVSPPWEGTDQRRLMLRTLLAERFLLDVHKETKELPTFELMPAREDGRLGPQLRRAAADCAALSAARQAAARSGAPPAAPSRDPGPGSCGITMNPGRISFGGSPLRVLATTLSPLMQRVVVDRTGLTGNWDFELTYTPDQSQLPPGAPLPGQLPDVNPNAPSLVTALEEQLGLRLRSARGPVEVLVVDRVERPTEN